MKRWILRDFFLRNECGVSLMGLGREFQRVGATVAHTDGVCGVCGGAGAQTGKKQSGYGGICIKQRET